MTKAPVFNKQIKKRNNRGAVGDREFSQLHTFSTLLQAAMGDAKVIMSITGEPLHDDNGNKPGVHFLTGSKGSNIGHFVAKVRRPKTAKKLTTLDSYQLAQQTNLSHGFCQTYAVMNFLGKKLRSYKQNGKYFPFGKTLRDKTAYPDHQMYLVVINNSDSALRFIRTSLKKKQTSLYLFNAYIKAARQHAESQLPGHLPPVNEPEDLTTQVSKLLELNDSDFPTALDIQ